MDDGMRLLPVAEWHVTLGVSDKSVVIIGAWERDGILCYEKFKLSAPPANPNDLPLESMKMPEIPDCRNLPLLPKELWRVYCDEENGFVALGIWEHPAGCVWYEKAKITPPASIAETNQS